MLTNLKNKKFTNRRTNTVEAPASTLGISLPKNNTLQLFDIRTVEKFKTKLTTVQDRTHFAKRSGGGGLR
jgi:hypothetical protein